MESYLDFAVFCFREEAEDPFENGCSAGMCLVCGHIHRVEWWLSYVMKQFINILRSRDKNDDNDYVPTFT